MFFKKKRQTLLKKKKSRRKFALPPPPKKKKKKNVTILQLLVTAIFPFSKSTLYQHCATFSSKLEEVLVEWGINTMYYTQFEIMLLSNVTIYKLIKHFLISVCIGPVYNRKTTEIKNPLLPSPQRQ